jgi:DDE superfamily endonuclease/Helix-turn-helix of DDE superfamily endonuclease
MTIIEDYLDRSPEQAKRIIGINIDQFQELVKQAEAIHHQKQQARPRLIQAGGGRRRKLSVKQEILLTLVYLNQFPTFLMLGIQLEVSESTAHDVFHYWVETLSEILPASLMEQVKKKDNEREWIESVLTELELIVDSYQQPIQRPSDPKEEPKYYSKYKAGHTLKNQLIVTPNGREIVDGVVGYPGPTNDLSLWRSRQQNFLETQQFQGDTAYIGESTISTPQKKPRLGRLTPEAKEENRRKSQKRIRVEHLIRLVKIFRIASERFRLHAKNYPSIISLVYGLVRYRIGSFIFS